MSGAFGLSLYFRMVHPSSCWPALLYNASHDIATTDGGLVPEASRDCRLALLSLGLFVRRLLPQDDPAESSGCNPTTCALRRPPGVAARPVRPEVSRWPPAPTMLYAQWGAASDPLVGKSQGHRFPAFWVDDNLHHDPLRFG